MPASTTCAPAARPRRTISRRSASIARRELAAQSVIGTERDHEKIGYAATAPVEAGETTGARVPRDPCVDDPHRPAALREELPHERRVGCLLTESQPRRQTVAEKATVGPAAASDRRRRRRDARRRHRRGLRSGPGLVPAAAHPGGSSAATVQPQRHSHELAMAPEPCAPSTGLSVVPAGFRLSVQKDPFAPRRRSHEGRSLQTHMLTCSVAEDMTPTHPPARCPPRSSSAN